MGDQMSDGDVGDNRQRAAGHRYPLTCTVNGTVRSLLVEGDRRLLSVLRDELGLTGAKAGCEVGVCGACTVLVDGKPTSSCLTFAAQADGAEVLTVEGIGIRPDLRRLQLEFIAEGGFQCGFCTSGQLMTAASLVMSGELRSLSDHGIRERMLGNLCRCGAYYGIIRAIGKAREAMEE
jgi:aerobic-type carbon monoxide dehydrogenase small subunit (CoxS/CutS family)